MEKIMEQELIDLIENKYKIANKILDGVSQDGVNVDVDLSEFSTGQLRAFYFDISAFNIIANNDKFEDFFDEETMLDIVNGRFVLKKYSLSEGHQIERKKYKMHASKLSFKVQEQHIQDGIYYFQKACDRRAVEFFSVLETKSPEIFIDGVDATDSFSPEKKLRIFRNIVAHSNQIVANQGRVSFTSDNFRFVCSQMWLRGFSTLWSSRHKTLDYEKIKTVILSEYGEGKKSIKSENDIKKILNLTSDYTDYKKDGTYASRMYVLMCNRLKYYSNYYGMVDENGKEDFDRKIDIFINVIANNPNHISGNAEYLNSKIIYNIQQMVAVEIGKKLEQRHGVIFSDSFNVCEANKKLEKIGEQTAVFMEIENKFNKHMEEMKKRTPLQRNLYYKAHKSEIDTLMKKGQKLNRDGLSALKEVDKDASLETENMELFDKMSLKNMPIETAVNLVAFMGYNRFVSTDFYKIILEQQPTLTQKQVKAIQNMDLSQFNMTKQYSDSRFEKRIPLNSDDLDVQLNNRLTFLRRIRHATSHGLISYSIPQNTKAGATMDNVIMTYSADGEQRLKISGSVMAFKKLFKSDFFCPIGAGGKLPEKVKL